MPGAAATTAQAIHEQLQATVPNGATPTASTLRAAHEVLKGMTSPTSTQTVLLVTDGAPNCAAGDIGGLTSVGVGNSASQQPEAVPQTVSVINAMANDGIKTYVLGYDTQKDPALKNALDRMAKAGGTGDQVHHAVESHATLSAALQQLASRTIKCELALKSAVVDPWKVVVKLDGQVLTPNDPNGFTLDAAGDNLTLQGSACTAVQARPEPRARCASRLSAATTTAATRGGRRAGRRNLRWRRRGTTSRAVQPEADLPAHTGSAPGARRRAAARAELSAPRERTTLIRLGQWDLQAVAGLLS